MMDIVFFRRFLRKPEIGDLCFAIVLDVTNAADETNASPAELVLDLTHVTVGLRVDVQPHDLLGHVLGLSIRIDSRGDESGLGRKGMTETQSERELFVFVSEIRYEGVAVEKQVQISIFSI